MKFTNNEWLLAKGMTVQADMPTVSILALNDEFIKETAPKCTIREMQEILSRHGVRVCEPTLRSYLRRNNINYVRLTKSGKRQVTNEN